MLKEVYDEFGQFMYIEYVPKNDNDNELGALELNGDPSMLEGDMT